MAKRYCGDVIIDVRWHPETKTYETTVRCPNGLLKIGTSVLMMSGPAFYDFIAKTALEAAIEHSSNKDASIRQAARAIADAAALGLANRQYFISRRAP